MTFAKALMSAKVQADSILKSVRQGTVFANETNETIEVETGIDETTEKQTENETETDVWSHDRILQRLRTIHYTRQFRSSLKYCVVSVVERSQSRSENPTCR